jgi:hypothetical protein
MTLSRFIMKLKKSMLLFVLVPLGCYLCWNAFLEWPRIRYQIIDAPAINNVSKSRFGMSLSRIIWNKPRDETLSVTLVMDVPGKGRLWLMNPSLKSFEENTSVSVVGINECPSDRPFVTMPIDQAVAEFDRLRVVACGSLP